MFGRCGHCLWIFPRSLRWRVINRHACFFFTKFANVPRFVRVVNMFSETNYFIYNVYGANIFNVEYRKRKKKIQFDFKRNVKLHVILSCRVIKNDISNYIVVDVIEVVVQEPKPIQKMCTKSVLDVTLISHLTTRIYCYLLSTGLSGISKSHQIKYCYVCNYFVN